MKSNLHGKTFILERSDFGFFGSRFIFLRIHYESFVAIFFEMKCKICRKYNISQISLIMNEEDENMIIKFNIIVKY